MRSSDFASRSWLHGATLKPHPLNQPLADGFACCLLAPDGQQPSELFQRSAAADQGRRSLYFALPEEVCARAFENLLQRQPLQNSFLVSGTLPAARQSLQTAASTRYAVYPTAAESSALARYWLPYFEQLGTALQRQRAAMQ